MSDQSDKPYYDDEEGFFDHGLLANFSGNEKGSA